MYLNLMTEMNRLGITNENIADELHIHRNSVSNKINGDTPLTLEEAKIIREKFFPYADFQYLFRKVKTDKAS
jgi:plasmid maintenance system antidote protein VapI